MFYRATTAEVAERIGVRGLVRNERDGSVTAIAVGTPEQQREFEAFLRVGPKHAVVESVEKRELLDVAPSFYMNFAVARR